MSSFKEATTRLVKTHCSGKYWDSLRNYAEKMWDNDRMRRLLHEPMVGQMTELVYQTWLCLHPMEKIITESASVIALVDYYARMFRDNYDDRWRMEVDQLLREFIYSAIADYTKSQDSGHFTKGAMTK